jgi:ABC-2 type transport system permease protein
MTIRGIWLVAAVEWAKLRAQLAPRAALAACVVGPFAFVAAIRVQSSVPEDTLFGRAVKESGFAAPLVVLGFSTLWVFPALASLVGGDLFSAEDRYGTWATVLTRSRSRAEVFAGKVLTAMAFSVGAVATLAASSMSAGALVIGRQPLVDLSAALVPPGVAALHVALAWASVMPPVLAFTALAVLVSIATRSSAAGIGLPVALGLLMQLAAYVDGPDAVRRLLLTAAFGGWHGLLASPSYDRPLMYAAATSTAYLLACLTGAYHLFGTREIDG